MNTFNITNAGTINGVDVTTFGSHISDSTIHFT